MSRAADGKVMFGEWLPDLPDTDNPGLSYLLNALPLNKFYAAYKPIAGTGTALSERPRGGCSALDSSGNAYLYAGSATKLWQRSGSGWTDKSGAAYTTGTKSYWRFAQYDDLVIGTNYDDVPQSITVGSGSNFAALATVGTAPKARQIGIVGQHVVLGDTVDGTNGTVPHRIQWSRIGVASEWPTPNTADALAKQAGEQFMPSEFGPVTGIIGNDQFGIVFQRTSISRMTYVGGDIVYQFDVIESSRGCSYPNAIVQVGKGAYFIAADGFYFTDGNSVTPIGVGKFDQYFLDSVDTGNKERAYGALDKLKKLIYWTYPGQAAVSGQPNAVLTYNYAENRAAPSSDTVECLITALTTATTLEDLDALFASIDVVTPPLDDPYWQGGNEVLQGFTSDYKLGTFAGTPGTAIIDGAEAELNPGLMTFVTGVRPIVQGQSSVTVALGTRNDYANDPAYTPDTSLTSRTGFADFRKESRMVRARVKITGDFPAAQGVYYQASAMGAA